jgi:hypothetical protein
MGTMGKGGGSPKKKATAKKSPLSPKQSKIAKTAGDKKKIDSADLAALRKKKKK